MDVRPICAAALRADVDVAGARILGPALVSRAAALLAPLALTLARLLLALADREAPHRGDGRGLVQRGPDALDALHPSASYAAAAALISSAARWASRSRSVA